MTAETSVPPAPTLEFAFELVATVAAPERLGSGDGMVRRMVPITGGTVQGPLLSGTIMPGGADWQVIRERDGTTRLAAHYVIRAADGGLIAVENRGLRRGPPAVMKRLLAGEAVPADAIYFRTAPTFEADGRHEWMNDTLFVASGRRERDRVIVRVYAVR